MMLITLMQNYGGAYNKQPSLHELFLYEFAWVLYNTHEFLSLYLTGLLLLMPMCVRLIRVTPSQTCAMYNCLLRKGFNGYN